MYVYKLFEIGKEGDIKYVGKTVKPLKYRLYQHRSAAKFRVKPLALADWIKSIDYNIGISLIEEVESKKELNRREKYWIKYHRKIHNLVNTVSGGASGPELFGTNNPKAQRILQYDLKGSFIREWGYIKEACDFLSINNNKISNCINLDRVKSGGGFIWKKYEENYPLKIEPYKVKKPKLPNERAIYQYSLEGNFIEEFENRGDAARKLKVDRANILYALKAKTTSQYAAGFFWIYKEHFSQQLLEQLIENYKNKHQKRYKTKVIKYFILYKNDKVIKSFKSLLDIGKYLNTIPTRISEIRKLTKKIPKKFKDYRIKEKTRKIIIYI